MYFFILNRQCCGFKMIFSKSGFDVNFRSGMLSRGILVAQLYIHLSKYIHSRRFKKYGNFLNFLNATVPLSTSFLGRRDLFRTRIQIRIRSFITDMNPDNTVTC
jgi:hypothetical protein